jgi:hypothetical protein
MEARRSSLGPILILSAIDVLLCGFSAGLALFFVGAGAGVTDNAVGAPIAPTNVGSDARGHGAPAGIVIVHYDDNSAKLRPASGSIYEAIPEVGWESANDVTWLLNELPTPKKPFVLVGGNTPGTVGVGLRISILGKTSRASFSCRNGNALEIRISSTGTDTDTGLCHAR